MCQFENLHPAFCWHLGAGRRRHIFPQVDSTAVWCCRRSRRARRSRWPLWPHRSWFTFWSLWSSHARQAWYTLDPWKTFWSWYSSFTRKASFTFLAFCPRLSSNTDRSFSSLNSYLSFIATGAWFTWFSPQPCWALWSNTSTSPNRPPVTFAPGQSHRPFWATLTTVPFGSWWSRSTC